SCRTPRPARAGARTGIYSGTRHAISSPRLRPSRPVNPNHTRETKEPRYLQGSSRQLDRSRSEPRIVYADFVPTHRAEGRFALTQSAAARLKELDKISGWVREKNLRSAWPGHNVVAEFDTGGAQPRGLGRNILHDKVDAVPATGTGPLAIGHRSPGRTFGPTQQEPQRTQRDIGESRRGVGEECEAKVFGVPRNRGVHVVDHVTDIDRCY